jgi:cobalt-zinc-cadmium efflux system membrane fusion protein
MRRLMMLVPLVLVACHGHDHDGESDHHGAHGDAMEDQRPALSFTDWTDASELFIELRALVRGQESACAAHVTKLPGFEALADGRVTVVLRGGLRDERFESRVPTVPGIFRPVARPTSTGRRRLIVEIRAAGLSVDHDLGDVTVYASVAAARAAIPEEPEVAGRIPFLKEQQWPIDFGTQVVTERTIRASLRATGSVRARADGEVVVNAPVAGRVGSSSGVFPHLGARVAADDVLGVLAPRLDAADLASLELAVTSSNFEVRFADRERQRLDALRTEGAVPERRVQDAAHVADEARASLAAAQRRLEQFRRVQRTAGRGEGSVQLRAPLSGTITEVLVAPGTFVEAGAPLFRLTDLTQVWLEARVAEADAARLGTPRGATFLVEGRDAPIELPADALVARGRVIDPLTQTLPLMFALDNATAQLPLGAFARVTVLTGDERRAVAVPEASLVEDGGLVVVFVQVEGEAFERRVVRVGAHDGGYAEALSGVRVGEHVVTVGAWSVKLAASSGAIPAHGHSH